MFEALHLQTALCLGAMTMVYFQANDDIFSLYHFVYLDEQFSITYANGLS